MYKRNRAHFHQFLRQGKKRSFQITAQKRYWRNQGIKQC